MGTKCYSPALAGAFHRCQHHHHLHPRPKGPKQVLPACTSAHAGSDLQRASGREAQNNPSQRPSRAAKRPSWQLRPRCPTVQPLDKAAAHERDQEARAFQFGPAGASAGIPPPLHSGTETWEGKGGQRSQEGGETPPLDAAPPGYPARSKKVLGQKKDQAPSRARQRLVARCPQLADLFPGQACSHSQNPEATTISTTTTPHTHTALYAPLISAIYQGN